MEVGGLGDSRCPLAVRLCERCERIEGHQIRDTREPDEGFRDVAGRLIVGLVRGTEGQTAGPLLLTGGAIWLTNVIVFALWYWELDRGGPAARAVAPRPHPDFLFAQMQSPELAPDDWEPQFADYLYLSFTNATAFSPTDVLPLSRWAKLTMMLHSLISLATVALVIARAVNILKG